MNKITNTLLAIAFIILVSPTLSFAMTTDDVTAQYKLFKHGDPILPKVLGASTTNTTRTVPTLDNDLSKDQKKVLMKGLKFASGSTKIISSPIKEGSKGDDVKKLQVFLGTQGHLKADPTGQYGPKTKDAVVKFQKIKGLIPDGKVGNNTIENISFDVNKLSEDK